MILIAMAVVCTYPLMAKKKFEKGNDDVHYEYSVTFDQIKDAYKNQGQEKDKINLDKVAANNSQPPVEEKPDIDSIKSFAESGNKSYQFLLGKYYAEGKYLEQDYEKALHWYGLAAEQGEFRAQNNLGCLYMDGAGVEKDLEKALYWLEKSAGQDTAYAMLNLGELYQKEKGDYSAAMEWYKKAEKKEPKLAWYSMALLYRDGLGVKKDIKKARSYLKKSSKLGYKEADKVLAELE